MFFDKVVIRYILSKILISFMTISVLNLEQKRRPLLWA